MSNFSPISGIGCPNFQLAVYIGNIPNMPEYQGLETVSPMTLGEITSIGQACGNGWRKVFNVYAKLIFELNNKPFSLLGDYHNWQQYRDSRLLQSNSQTALLFSPPNFSDDQAVHIICGKTHAANLIQAGLLTAQLDWLDHEFAIDSDRRLIVCPYFDYRQLSNIKIVRLTELIKSL